MSTTNYQQTSDPKEFHPISRSDKEKRNINPTGASAEQIFRDAPGGTSLLQHGVPQFVNRHNVDARHADLSMIGRDQRYHINLNIFNFRPRIIYYIDGTNVRTGIAGTSVSNRREFLTIGDIALIGAILLVRHYFVR